MGAKVLLLGSTGFVGRGAARAILDAGHQLRVMVRDQDRVPELGNRRVEVRAGDASNLGDLQDACRDVDHVVSLVAVRRDRPQSLLDVNVEAPRRLGEAARATSVKSVVFVSAIGAGPHPKLRYLSSRWMGEEELRRTGVPLAILRFSFVLGPDGGLVRDFERAASFGPVIVIPGSGQTQFQPLVRDDAARCIALAIGREDLVGKAIDLGGPEVVTYEHLFDLFAQARGIRKPRLKVPIGLLMPAAHVMQVLMPDPLVVPDELRTIQLDNLADGLDSILSHFGFRPLSPTVWAAEHWKTAPRVPAA